MTPALVAGVAPGVSDSVPWGGSNPRERVKGEYCNISVLNIFSNIFLCLNESFYPTD